MGSFSLFTSQSHCASNRDAPYSLSALISTPAGQLWSCDVSTHTHTHKRNCDTTHTWRVECPSDRSWLVISCRKNKKNFLEIYRMRSLDINVSSIRQINGTTEIARTWIAPVVCTIQFEQLCTLDHPICLSPHGRSSSRGGWMWQETGHWAAASSQVPNSPMSRDRMMIIGLLLNVFSHGKLHVCTGSSLSFRC